MKSRDELPELIGEVMKSLSVEFGYVREKLDFLGNKFTQAYGNCVKDLDEFINFLGTM